MRARVRARKRLIPRTFERVNSSRGDQHGVAADGKPVQRRIMMDSRSGEGLQYVWQLDLRLEPTHKRRPVREFMVQGQHSQLQTELDINQSTTVERRVPTYYSISIFLYWVYGLFKFYRMDKIYGTKDAAQFLGVSEARVRQYIQEDRLCSSKIGRDHLIEGAVLEDFARYGRKKTGRPSKKSCASDSNKRN